MLQELQFSSQCCFTGHILKAKNKYLRKRVSQSLKLIFVLKILIEESSCLLSRSHYLVSTIFQMRRGLGKIVSKTLKPSYDFPICSFSTAK